MILSRLTAKSQTTVPRAVRAALGIKPGEMLQYVIVNGEVRLAKAAGEPSDNPFAMFTEWADELDSVYDDLDRG